MFISDMSLNTDSSEICLLLCHYKFRCITFHILIFLVFDKYENSNDDRKVLNIDNHIDLNAVIGVNWQMWDKWNQSVLIT